MIKRLIFSYLKIIIYFDVIFQVNEAMNKRKNIKFQLYSVSLGFFGFDKNILDRNLRITLCLRDVILMVCYCSQKYLDVLAKSAKIVIKLWAWNELQLQQFYIFSSQECNIWRMKDFELAHAKFFVQLHLTHIFLGLFPL